MYFLKFNKIIILLKKYYYYYYYYYYYNEVCPLGHLTFMSKRLSASQAKGSRNPFIQHTCALRSFEKL